MSKTLKRWDSQQSSSLRVATSPVHAESTSAFPKVKQWPSANQTKLAGNSMKIPNWLMSCLLKAPIILRISWLGMLDYPRVPNMDPNHWHTADSWKSDEVQCVDGFPLGLSANGAPHNSMVYHYLPQRNCIFEVYIYIPHSQTYPIQSWNFLLHRSDTNCRRAISSARSWVPSFQICSMLLRFKQDLARATWESLKNGIMWGHRTRAKLVHTYKNCWVPWGVYLRGYGGLFLCQEPHRISPYINTREMGF